jgi:hypothetical protein
MCGRRPCLVFDARKKGFADSIILEVDGQVGARGVSGVSRRRGGEVDKSNPAAPWLMVQDGTGCYRQQCRMCSSQDGEPQSAAEDGEEGCVVVEWEWEGKKEGQDEAGLRWSQIPTAWRACRQLSTCIEQ